MPKILANTRLKNVLSFSSATYVSAIIFSILVGITLFFVNNSTERTKLPEEKNPTPELQANFDKCEIGKSWITVSGWAVLKAPNDTIKIHLIATGKKGALKLITRRLYRKDVSDFLKIKSDFHLHGFSASAVGYRFRKYYGDTVKLYIEDSKGVMHYGGENVCTAI